MPPRPPYLKAGMKTAKEFLFSNQNRKKVLDSMSKTLPDPAQRRLLSQEKGKVAKTVELKQPSGKGFLGKAWMGVPDKPTPAKGEIDIIGKMAKGTTVQDYHDFVAKTDKLFPPGERINISVAMNEMDIPSLKKMGATTRVMLMEYLKSVKSGTIPKAKLYRVLGLTGFFTAASAMPLSDFKNTSPQFQNFVSTLGIGPEESEAGPIGKAFKQMLKKMGPKHATFDDLKTFLNWSAEEAGKKKFTNKQALKILRNINYKEFGKDEKHIKEILKMGTPAEEGISNIWMKPEKTQKLLEGKK